MLQVILNADDFGKSPGRNRAIDEALRKGMVTSAGLIVTGKYLQEAVRYISDGGYAEKIHLHVNLSSNLQNEGSDDIPLTAAMREDPLFCSDGQFSQYNGLPQHLRTILKWRIVYHEIVAQYERFIDITQGKGNTSHIDFHLWYNLTWPVSIALNLFTWKYNIKSVRYFGVHQKQKFRPRLYRLISWKPCVKNIPSTNIDFFLSKTVLFKRYNLIELYCHPNYKDGQFLDDSPSYLKHERQPMTKHLQLLNGIDDIKYISW